MNIELLTREELLEELKEQWIVKRDLMELTERLMVMDERVNTIIRRIDKQLLVLKKGDYNVC